jgi:xanthine dehydrogenase YagT iron-sulfur-binding subunit
VADDLEHTGRDRHDPVTLPVRLSINGQQHELLLDARTTLLDALREHLHLTGSKKGCDHGQCGACTILVEGMRVNACLTFAIMHEGERIVTVEGLPTLSGAPERTQHPLQTAFIAHDAFQCGYCTPGQLCSAAGVLEELRAGVPSHVSPDVAQAPEPTVAEIRERMSGNLCRCGAYPHIVAAIRELATGQAGED